MNTEKEAAKMEEDIYFKLGFTPKTLMYAILFIKLLMLLFVVSASYGFYMFYAEFEELGCNAYCKTKTIGVSAQTQYDYLNNPSHSENPSPKSVFYQNLDLEP